jgi:arginine/serine-rich splicing factor 1/9
VVIEIVNYNDDAVFQRHVQSRLRAVGGGGGGAGAGAGAAPSSGGLFVFNPSLPSGGGRMALVYVGGLPDDIRSSEIRDIFDKFGSIRNVDIKTPRAPGGNMLRRCRCAPAGRDHMRRTLVCVCTGQATYAFVEFEDDRNAEDAVRDRDGYKFAGARLRVEMWRGKRDFAATLSSGGLLPVPSGGGRGPPRRTDYKVIVENLPSGASWQDLRDHMRKAGEVGYAEVNADGGWRWRCRCARCHALWTSM